MLPSREQFKEFIAAIKYAQEKEDKLDKAFELIWDDDQGQHVPFYISPLWSVVYKAFNLLFGLEDIEGVGNELSWWFEIAPENEAKYYIDDVEHNVSDIDAFYDYLVEEAKQKQQAKNKRQSNMSGGAFEYQQYHIEEIADDIEQEIIEAGREIPQEIWAKNHWYGSSFDDSDRTYPTYERKTIDIMKRAVYVLRMAYIYAKRVDWMLSGDDGEDTLVERLQEELQALKAKYPSGKFTFKEKDVYFDKECERYMLKDTE